MPRFANMIEVGMTDRGHSVQVLTSRSILGRTRGFDRVGSKWLNYIDQFVLFPPKLALIVSKLPPETLVVVADQALGIWIPRVSHRPHVVHCHDFLALRSAANEITQNPTSWTGKWYQRLIQRGFRKASNFISVSQHTRNELQRFLLGSPRVSEVVYNGLNGPFCRLERNEAEKTLRDYLTARERNGFILHVGGNQWYKNRCGVLAIYASYCKLTNAPLPLWMIGQRPNNALNEVAKTVPQNGHVRFLTDFADRQVVAAYNLAHLLLFPSFEEGFGWPIAESMACGTRVVTTNAPPMTEVGGAAAYYIPRGSFDDPDWALSAAEKVSAALVEDDETIRIRIRQSLEQASKFQSSTALDKYEQIYLRILEYAGFRS